MTEDIVSRCDAVRDGDGPAVVICDQLVRGPRAWRRGIIDETTLVDFEELECRLVNIGTATRTLGQIIHDWPMVRLWPFCPLQLNSAAGCDLR